MKEFIKGSYGERYTNPKLRPKQTINKNKTMNDYEKGALEELKKIRFKLETCCGIEKLYVYTQTRIKELKFYKDEMIK